MDNRILEGVVLIGDKGVRLPRDTALEVGKLLAEGYTVQLHSPGQYLPAQNLVVAIDLNPHLAELSLGDVT